MIRKGRFLAAILLVLVQLSRPAISQTVGFKPAQSYPVGTAPVSVAAGDFNGDGKPDLAVANYGDGSVSILLGNGDGTFQPANNIAVGKNPGSIAVGDFNGDNRLDVVVANGGNDSVSVLLGNGDGTFQTHVDYATGINPHSVAIGDFNGDGRLDLAVANGGSVSVSVILGNGDGTFQPHVDYSGTGSVYSVAVADFNGDGRADLAVAGGSISGIVAILLGNGDGTFQSAVSYDTSGLFGTFVAVGDFNGDSKLDLMVSHANLGNITTSSVDLLLGKGDGTFLLGSTTLRVGCANRDPIGADFDGDGKLDLAVTGGGSSRQGVCVVVGQTLSVGVLAGNGDGTFQAPVNVTPGNALVAGAASLDLDGDKSPDLVTVNSDNTISVLLNSTGAEFSITASAPSPATVSRGQSSTSTVTFSHLNAFDNAVTLACSVQPTQSSPTCSLNANSVTFDANGNATSTLTINTGAATASLVPSSPRPNSRPLQFLWLPVAGLAFMGTGISRSSSGKRRLLGFFVGCVLFAGLILQSACGGASSSRNGPTSQTYTITVTGTSGSTQHSTTVTLTVQ